MVESKEIFTDCTLCYHSCGTKVTVEDGKAVKIRGLESHPLNKGRLCPKGARALDVVYSPNRLKQPLKRRDGGFEEISWGQALDEIAEKLTRLKNEYGPQVFGFFCGSSVSSAAPSAWKTWRCRPWSTWSARDSDPRTFSRWKVSVTACAFGQGN
jgi:anaerobic selenocysteine-containing dehydrogenase